MLHFQCCILVYFYLSLIFADQEARVLGLPDTVEVRAADAGHVPGSSTPGALCLRALLGHTVPTDIQLGIPFLATMPFTFNLIRLEIKFKHKIRTF